MLLTEPNRISDVLYFEGGEQFYYPRDNVTIPNQTTALVVGTVLGISSIGLAPTSAAKAGGNTGTGTLVLDVTAPIQPNAKPGNYVVTVVSTGVFEVVDPKGVAVGDEGVYTSAGSVTFNDQIKFVLTDTSTHFVAGDGFVITVAAGASTMTPLNVAAEDGSQNAAAVLLTPVAAAAGNVAAAVVDRGPALLKLNGLVWPAGFTSTQIAAGIAQLQALGMVTKADFGI
jgi:hypothetical protein